MPKVAELVGTSGAGCRQCSCDGNKDKVEEQEGIMGQNSWVQLGTHEAPSLSDCSSMTSLCTGLSGAPSLSVAHIQLPS